MALVMSNFVSLSFSPDQQSWNKLIKKQVLKGNAWQAIQSYVDMQESGLSADNFTFPILLKAVGGSSYFCLGLELHGQTIKTGFADHAYVQTALVKMYSSFGRIDDARKMFDKMPRKDSVAWNSMLDAYASNGQMDIAMELFDAMPVKDLSSYNIVVSGFAGEKRIKSARNMFDKMPVRDVVSWNSMILACINAGDMVEALALFEEAPQKNVITWNTMIMGCVQDQLYTEAIDLFCKMKAGNVEPDYLTVTGALSACAHLRSLETGVKIDMYARNHGQASSPHVVTALIDMYAKCGSIQNSLEVFYKSEDKDIYCWNAMISGLALHGHGTSALKLFNEMRENGMKPDDITFIGLLSACSHAGLVQEGCQLFGFMERDFKITPKIEHYGCMVDLLSRAKLLNRAFQFVETMPFEPGDSILGALLSACVIHQDVHTGEKVVKLIRKKGNNRLSDGEYMMFSNLYASCGRWEEANKWRSMMNDSGIVKTAGCSTIEVNGKLHKFLAGELGFDQE
ncbi:hypothetical protein TIFTF001_009481 [Ficus carica]|uniref:Pentatricopeptide repeat-containing protein n=1 Tax=Ficus carica TaxID=3494 RepID=A0AA88AAH3_FICCA|nr:hypothetical protein TIFTF001_009481 [Ficus carica]